eukprot:GGOE01005499.1.p1 GENE.GGOE01005499.1~~GGOE01005499.1.p1  ORF type:complete len:234 (+),score=59.52 GGOE01005499.1:34-702(+)
MDEPFLGGRDATGLPTRSEYAGMAMPIAAYHLLVTLFSIALGQAAAWPIYLYLSDSLVKHKLRFLADQHLGWMLLSVFGVKLGLTLMHMISAMWRHEIKVNRPDQYVFRVYTPLGVQPLPYVLLETAGDVGRFNRFQMAVDSYVECLPLAVAYIVLMGSVFPLPTFLCTAVFLLSSLASGTQYAQAPPRHKFGSVIIYLSMTVIEGLLLLSAGKALAIQYDA